MLERLLTAVSTFLVWLVCMALIVFIGFAALYLAVLLAWR
jgi:hypothetical protein